MSNPISNTDPSYFCCGFHSAPFNVTPVGPVKSIEEQLAEEHLAARFERVQRRWEAKHQPPVVMSRWDLRETF